MAERYTDPAGVARIPPHPSWLLTLVDDVRYWGLSDLEQARYCGRLSAYHGRRAEYHRREAARHGRLARRFLIVTLVASVAFLLQVIAALVWPST